MEIPQTTEAVMIPLLHGDRAGDVGDVVGRILQGQDDEGRLLPAQEDLDEIQATTIAEEAVATILILAIPHRVATLRIQRPQAHRTVGHLEGNEGMMM